MLKTIPLSKAASYVTERIASSKIHLNDFVTTDNMLQNKGGITLSSVSPTGTLTAFKKGDVLVANIRPYLKKIWYADRDGGCSTDVLVLRARTGYDPRFVFYSLFRDDFFNHVMKAPKGTKMPRGDKGHILHFPVPYLPFPVQQKITAVLSSLDDKIELNNRINAELEAMAKTVYDYWFVQFDFLDENGKPYKSSSGKMVYNETLKREIPEGWEVGTLYDVVSLEYGKPLKQEERTGYGYPVFGSNGIVGYHKEFLVVGPGIIVGRKGSAGEVIRTGENFYPIDTTYFVVDRIGITPLHFHYQFLLKCNLKSVESSSAVPGLNKNVAHSLPTVIPPQKLIKEYTQTISSFYQMLDSNKKENSELANLRDWLLPLLMNGQVSVGEAYVQIAETLNVAAEDTSIYNNNPSPIPTNKRGFAKYVLAGKIIQQCRTEKEFTPIKFQKLQHLAEYLLEEDLGQSFYGKRAGPYNNKLMYPLCNKMRKQHWFDEKNFVFIPLEKATEIDTHFSHYFGRRQAVFEKLVHLLGNATEAQCEIVSTLFAVWNDMLIQKEAITDDEIISRFYRWSDRKKAYTEEQLIKALQWMREHELTPKGFGPAIKHAKEKKNRNRGHLF